MNNIVSQLNHLLADYQVYYQRLRNFHWNVTGPHFFTLHEKFEELYGEASDAVDALAERILAIGGKPVSTLTGQLAMARLKESDADLNASAMVAQIVDDLAALNHFLTELAGTASESGDSTTAGLAEEWKAGQEQHAWMLRAFNQ